MEKPTVNNLIKLWKGIIFEQAEKWKMNHFAIQNILKSKESTSARSNATVYVWWTESWAKAAVPISTACQESVCQKPVCIRFEFFRVRLHFALSKSTCTVKMNSSFSASKGGLGRFPVLTSYRLLTGLPLRFRKEINWRTLKTKFRLLEIFNSNSSNPFRQNYSTLRGQYFALPPWNFIRLRKSVTILWKTNKCRQKRGVPVLTLRNY